MVKPRRDLPAVPASQSKVCEVGGVPMPPEAWASGSVPSPAPLLPCLDLLRNFCPYGPRCGTHHVRNPGVATVSLIPVLLDTLSGGLRFILDLGSSMLKCKGITEKRHILRTRPFLCPVTVKRNLTCDHGKKLPAMTDSSSQVTQTNGSGIASRRDSEIPKTWNEVSRGIKMEMHLVAPLQ